MNNGFTYRLCDMMIRNGRTSGLQEKIDVYFAMERLTQEEYEDLCAKLNPEAKAAREGAPEMH